MNYQIPKGTQDILPGESERWQYIEQKARQLCERYNYREIRTPMFEQTELFARGVGDTTDIVQKEMYTFKDHGGRSITLRPEGTAAVVRSYVENKMHGWAEQPQKLYYTGPMFRYERPQSGRMRQFVQFGIEAIGCEDPAIDVEVMALAMDFYREFGLNNVKLVINSLGDQSSRKAHRDALVRHFEPSIDEFCSDCKERLETNPLRILDCKQDSDHPLMADAPSILDYLNDESREYFETVKSQLDSLGIPYEVDPGLVRGLDYYNSTAFEIMLEGEGFGAISTLSGGGRYNGLVEDIGGPQAPGIGFALSIERLLMALDAQGIELPIEHKLDAYVVVMGDVAKQKAVQVVHHLRKDGYRVEMDYLNKKMKGQFKAADRLGASYTIVIGEDEVNAGTVNVKNMHSGEQKTVGFEEISNTIESSL
ncbi:histidine--tRNA ligase [Texcoconibacillus texcoconensis]|uniref:Histidine--tRNA ligase n=1 Tax=Texcoconibacillus texcoconensis TaxID=1095777 RepID=A0A840QP91_9BACI|nr:histidine--tRNA ligase [Texcoconibacillus texcoconensis]MBB5173194.1 histidyl-tRNA synthetase [Texcoconibacillus texcoconensis]